jgi:hypothetical protein
VIFSVTGAGLAVYMLHATPQALVNFKATSLGKTIYTFLSNK